jgi:uncharacterized membrane protein
VEQEVLGPAVRCVVAAFLGIGLLAAAEWLSRKEPPSLPGPLRADQAPAGLAAGGTAILFAAAYGAGPFYDLLPPLLAFAGMAAASVLALLAALRYGPLTAATGIVGAFATPAMVTTEDPSLPSLFIYLTAVSAVALAVVRYTAWTWLSWATTIAGAIWICIAAGLSGSRCKFAFCFTRNHMGLLFRTVDDAELWAWSGGWLTYGIALMARGIQVNDSSIRRAALVVLGLSCAKVFLIDMSDLTGLWRVVSFLGLGLALIGLGAAHRRFVVPR